MRFLAGQTRKAPPRTMKKAKLSPILIVILCLPTVASARAYKLEEILDLARKGNPGLAAGEQATAGIEAQLLEAKRSWMPTGELNSLLSQAPRISCTGQKGSTVDPKTGELIPAATAEQNCVQTQAIGTNSSGFLNAITPAGVFTRTELKLVQPIYTFGKISAGVAARHPEDRKLRFQALWDRAWTLGEGGRAEGGKATENLGAWQNALSAARDILALEPGEPESIRYLADCYRNLGDAYKNTGDRAAALESYRQALAVDEKRAAGDPASAQPKMDLYFDLVASGWEHHDAGHGIPDCQTRIPGIGLNKNILHKTWKEAIHGTKGIGQKSKTTDRRSGTRTFYG